MNNMTPHTALGPTRFVRLRAIVMLVRSGAITLGGNGPGRIYGRLDCRAGKRMKPANRVFFHDEDEAVALGFRPCAKCLPTEYIAWRESC